MNDSKLNTVEKQQKSGIKEISKIILILIIPIAFVAYRYFTAQPAGFCVAQNRFVPDEKFIKESLSFPFYLETSEFDGENRSLLNCCEVTRVESDFWSKVFREDKGVVVYFGFKKAQHAIDEQHPEKYYFALIHYESCGEIARTDSGSINIYFIDPFTDPVTGVNSIGKLLNSKDFKKWPHDGNQIVESLNTENEH